VPGRFYRAERSRHSTPGSGLGLSLVAAVARLHGLNDDGAVVGLKIAGKPARNFVSPRAAPGVGTSP
jgi:hypothetical protein